MNNKSIKIKNPPSNWRAYVPFGAEDLYHVEVTKLGYLHDVSIIIVLSPIIDGEPATGWDIVDAALSMMEQHMVDCWEMAQNDWAYSFKKII